MAGTKNGRTYSFRAGRSYKGVDAKTVAVELERIRESQPGGLEPQIVIDEARPIDAVLHNCFEWDDTIAAEAHRRRQARLLITAVIVKTKYNPDGYKLYVAIDNAPASMTRPKTYLPQEEVASNATLAHQYAIQLRSHILQAQSSLTEFQQLLGEDVPELIAKAAIIGQALQTARHAIDSLH